MSDNRSTMSQSLTKMYKRHGMDAVRRLLQDTAGVDKSAAVPDDKVEAVIVAANNYRRK